jgi:hypothetical protein
MDGNDICGNQKMLKLLGFSMDDVFNRTKDPAKVKK